MLLYSFGLNTLDACWIAVECGVIAVDAESIGLLVLDVMPIDIIIAIDIVTTLRSSINCSTVIRSPTVIFSIMRESSSEHYGPQVYSTPYFQPYTFYFVALSAVRCHFANNLEGIDNPFGALGARLFVFAQVLWT